MLHIQNIEACCTEFKYSVYFVDFVCSFNIKCLVKKTGIYCLEIKKAKMFLDLRDIKKLNDNEIRRVPHSKYIKYLRKSLNNYVTHKER